MAVASLLSFSTFILITSPTLRLPFSTSALCMKTFPCFLQSKIAPDELLEENLPLSPTCPPDSA